MVLSGGGGAGGLEDNLLVVGLTITEAWRTTIIFSRRRRNTVDDLKFKTINLSW